MPIKKFQKYLVISGFFLMSSAVMLEGCSTQKTVGQLLKTDEAAQNISTPDATTYGLVNNLAPEIIPMPSDNRLPSAIVNNAIAPSNQIYYFDENSVTLSPSNLESIRNQANYLKVHPTAKVRLEGYSDSRGSKEINMLIAYKWLQSVDVALLQDGVASAQIEMVSYGKEMPTVDGFGEPVWAKNRKVQLVYEES